MTEKQMKTLRYHAYGEPLAVLNLETTTIPVPQANHIRIQVKACALNPADWACCHGFVPHILPRGIGTDVAGIVTGVGRQVTDVQPGDAVLGNVNFNDYTSAGAAEEAVLDHWAKIPQPLDFTEAAALPMAVTTAYAHLKALDLHAGQTLVVHGAGSMIGYAAVQIARLNHVNVIATAGQTFAKQLEAFGATVTSYGPGRVERVLALANNQVDAVLETASASGALPDLIKMAGNHPDHVMTISDHENAKKYGVRSTFSESIAFPYDEVLAKYAQLAAEGKFEIPIAQTFTIDDWQAAVTASLTGHAHGKLVILFAD